MDSYSEEIWKKRIRTNVDVDVSKVKDLKSFVDEVRRAAPEKYEEQTKTLIKNKDLFLKGSPTLQKDMFESMRAFASDIDDLKEFKKLEPATPESIEVVQNYAWNRASTRIRELRDAMDIRGLESLKNEVLGLRDDGELIAKIDNTIERLVIK